MPFAFSIKLAEFSADGNNASQKCDWAGYASHASTPLLFPPGGRFSCHFCFLLVDSDMNGC